MEEREIGFFYGQQLWQDGLTAETMPELLENSWPIDLGQTSNVAQSFALSCVGFALRAMAKWGEGDPRWIVEERPDATNVNNWHWTEKDCTFWSKEFFKQLCDGRIEEDGSVLKITSTQMDGDVVLGNRKGKIWFIYDLDLHVDWEVEFSKGGKATGSGIFRSVTQNDEDMEISITVNDETVDKVLARAFVSDQLVKNVKNHITKFRQALIDTHGKTVQLPPKSDGSSNGSTIGSPEKPKAKSDRPLSSSSVESKATKIDPSFANFSESVRFNCSPNDLYLVLTDPARVQAWTLGPVTMVAKPDGEFAMFSGNVSGKFLESTPNKKIVQKWRSKDWPEGVFSTVTITLQSDEDGTLLKLDHTGIPKSDYERTRHNWSEMCWNRIKAVFGFGALLR